MKAAMDKNDSLITIKVDYWGGKAIYIWKIVSLSEENLKYYIKEQKFNNSINK